MSGIINQLGSNSGLVDGRNLLDLDFDLSSGEKRIITFGDKGFQVWGVVDSTGTGNSSARTGIYGNSSSSGDFKVKFFSGYITKTGNRDDIGHVLFVGDGLYVRDHINGYFQGPSINALGLGTLSPAGSRWSAATNSSEDYEIQLASADGGTFYYTFFGQKV